MKKGIGYYFVYLLVYLFGAPDSPGLLSRIHIFDRWLPK